VERALCQACYGISIPNGRERTYFLVVVIANVARPSLNAMRILYDVPGSGRKKLDQRFPKVEDVFLSQPAYFSI